MLSKGGRHAHAKNRQLGRDRHGRGVGRALWIPWRGAYETCKADGLMALISHPPYWIDGIRNISGKRPPLQARIKVELSNLHRRRAMRRSVLTIAARVSLFRRGG